MILPATEFQLGRKKWKVRIVSTKQMADHLRRNHLALDDPYSEAANLHGLCDDQRCRILLNRDLNRCEETMLDTYWHEFAHALKYANGERDHCEADTERQGQLLRQFWETMNGNPYDSASPRS